MRTLERALRLAVGLLAFYWLLGATFGSSFFPSEPNTSAGAVVRGLSPLFTLTFLVWEVLSLRRERDLRWWVSKVFAPVLAVVVAGLAWLFFLAVASQVSVPQSDLNPVLGGILVVTGLIVARALRLAAHPGPLHRVLVDGMNLALAALLLPLAFLGVPDVVSDAREVQRAIVDPLSYDPTIVRYQWKQHAEREAARYYEDAIRTARPLPAGGMRIEPIAYSHMWDDAGDRLWVGVRVHPPPSVRVHVIQVEGQICIRMRGEVGAGCSFFKRAFSVRPMTLRIVYYWSHESAGQKPTSFNYGQVSSRIQWIAAKK